MHRRDLLRAAGVASALGPMLFTTAQSAAETGQAAADDAALSDKLNAICKQARVVGASAALFEDGNLKTATYGVANMKSGVDITTDTVMHIGSITKVINTTLLMQLVDEGLVDLDEPVRKYLPKLRIADMRALRKISVRMLVNHTSGIDGEIFPDFGPDKERIVDLVSRLPDVGQIHAPGADSSYCNVGTVLAGYLCQALKNKSWYELVEDQIFEPLEMNKAVVRPDYALLYRSSVGHYMDLTTGSTAMMAASDLIKFGLMHANNGVGENGARILSENSAKLMRQETARYQGLAGELRYGLGWALLGNGIVMHTGGGPGISSILYVHPESTSSLAVLTNTVTGGAVANALASEFTIKHGGGPLFAETIKIATQASDETVDASNYIGSYENSVVRYDVIQNADKISIVVTYKIAPYESMSLDPVTVSLKSASNDYFLFGPEGAAIGASGIIRFVNPDNSGNFQHLAIGGRLYKRTG